MHDSRVEGEPEHAAVLRPAPRAAQEAVAAANGRSGSASLFWMNERLLRHEISARPGNRPETATIHEEVTGFDLSHRAGVLRQSLQQSTLSGQALAQAVGEIAGTGYSSTAGLDADLPAPRPSDDSRAALQEVWSRLAPWPAHVMHLSLSTVLLDGYRGCCPAPGAGGVWPLRYRALRLQAVRSDGSVMVREWQFDSETANDNTLMRMAARLSQILRDDPPENSGPIGRLPLVSGPGQGAVILHELVGHLCEADQRARATVHLSRLDGLPPDLVIRDLPDLAFGPGHLPMDDEGTAPRSVTLCAEGRLRDSLFDRDTAQAAGLPATGNGRRQDYRHAPEPRMRNLAVAAGTTPQDALLDGIETGLWLDQCGPAWMDAGADRFGIEIAAGRMIRKGRLAEQIRGVSVTGAVSAALRGITAIGDEAQLCDQVVPCGKGGILRTGISGPAVRFNALQIG
ncbi:TldD/PmbA family protein [Phaeobacter sp. PT47_59]|nr:TldD/PmbA family protein [Phaeobacter sp. PT47_59]